MSENPMNKFTKKKKQIRVHLHTNQPIISQNWMKCLFFKKIYDFHVWCSRVQTL